MPEFNKDRVDTVHIVHHFTQIKKAGGGVPRAVTDLARVLADADDEVTLLTAADSDIPVTRAGGTQENLRVTELEDVSRPFQLLSKRGLRSAAEALATADVVHLHGLWRPRNSQIARLARHLGRPYVLSPHGMLNRWAIARHGWRKRIHYRLFERRNLAAARIVHFAAEAERDEAAGWIPHSRSRVIPLAIVLSSFEDLPGIQGFNDRFPGFDGRPIVLMLGRLDPSKRPELAIEALGRLRSTGMESHLFFAGEGNPEYVEGLRSLARLHGVSEVTHFVGLVVGPLKLSLYQRADVTVLPTRGENFGLVLFESLACGTPVITTRGANTWSDVLRSGGGRVVEPTGEALAACLLGLLSNDGHRESMGRAGREWVFKWLDPRALARQYQDMYQSVLPGA